MIDTYIIVVGNNKEKIAQEVAKYYDTKVVNEHGDLCLVVNSDLEADLCISEEASIKAIEEMNAALPGLNITLENFEF